MSATLGEPTPIVRVAAPLRQELLGQIRDAIASSVYKPGERLIERVLCEQYAVSRTVVREVLRQLEAEGLVTMVANRGPVVTTLTRDDAKALFEMRAALESLAASWFAERATDADRGALTESCDTVERAYRGDDMHQWLEAKNHYYDVMLTGAHSELIRSTVVGLHARIQFLRGLSLQDKGRLERSFAEVRGIAELAVAGDAVAAGAAAKAHVEAAARAAFSRMAAPTDRQGNGKSWG